jgi:transmembrane sensor
MSNPRPDPPPDLTEAAAWFTRLGARSITTQTLRDFRAWRQDPANDAAYQEVEAAWGKTGALADDPDVMRATEAALTRRVGRRRPAWLSWPGVAWTGAVAGLLVIAVLFSVQRLTPTYVTAVGEQRLVRLGDGSRIHLNTDSKVRVAFRAAERRLVLERGEAFFDVAHDARRPFVVVAGDAQVRALGTRFDVRRTNGDVAVTLVEGRVHVQQDGQAAVLAPNQQVTASRRGLGVTRRADATQLTSWTTGRLVFHQTPLAQAIAEVNRYADRKIALEAPELAARQVNGVFDVGDTDSFVRGVSALFDLKASTGPNGAIRLEPASAAAAT